VVCEECGEEVAVRRVPSITLEFLVGTLLGGSSVDFVKVDAQGYDMRVLRTAGSAAPLIKRAQLEITSDWENCTLGLAGGEKCSDVVKGMRERGWRTEAWCEGVERFPVRGGCCSTDFVFVSEGGL